MFLLFSPFLFHYFFPLYFLQRLFSLSFSLFSGLLLVLCYFISFLWLFALYLFFSFFYYFSLLFLFSLFFPFYFLFYLIYDFFICFLSFLFISLYYFLAFFNYCSLLFHSLIFCYFLFKKKHRATISGNRIVASPKTFTDCDFGIIFPHEIASSGLAPASLPSNSWELFM